jgi:hypothetical protein
MWLLCMEKTLAIDVFSGISFSRFYVFFIPFVENSILKFHIYTVFLPMVSDASCIANVYVWIVPKQLNCLSILLNHIILYDVFIPMSIIYDNPISRISILLCCFSKKTSFEKEISHRLGLLRYL